MTDPAPTVNAAGWETPAAFIQWKGTDVCLDFHCTCGQSSHFHGLFAYGLRCACGRVWAMPTTLVPVEGAPDNDLIQDVEPWRDR